MELESEKRKIEEMANELLSEKERTQRYGKNLKTNSTVDLKFFLFFCHSPDICNVDDVFDFVMFTYM